MLKDFADFLVNVATNWTGERIAALVIGVLIGGVGLLVVGRWLRWFIFPWNMKDWQREKERLTNDLERAQEKCSEEQSKNKSLLGLLDAQKIDRETDRSRALEKIRALSRDNDKGKVEAASQAALLAKYKTRHQKLACADFVLIPVLLDKPSADAVPLLLGWLKLLKRQGVCSQLAILGVLGNRVYRQTKLTGRETNLWHNLQTYCQEVWQEPVYLFQETVPNKNAFADAAEKRALAAFDLELKPVFTDIVNEVLSRMVIHDRRQPASLLA
ncbi:MAG: hypothetical protein L0215_00765 [Gemmataceae bacterium]|nr:hypothetical protein [Gemmataceae bacterium]